MIIFEKSIPNDPASAPLNRANVIARALRFKAYLDADPSRFHEEIAEKFDTARPLVSQYLKLLDRLPKSFINRMKDCDDSKLLRRFSGRKLLQIAGLESPEDREQEIARLISAIKH